MLLNAAWLDSDEQRRHQFQGPCCSRVRPFAAASESKQLGLCNYALLFICDIGEISQNKAKLNKAVSGYFFPTLTKGPANAPPQSNADVEKVMALDSLMIVPDH